MVAAIDARKSRSSNLITAMRVHSRGANTEEDHMTLYIRESTDVLGELQRTRSPS